MQVINACRKVSGQSIPVVNSPRRAGDPAKLIADSALAKTLLDWQPKYTTIEQIVETAWNWHRSHPNGYQ
jgi:UDP-glucose 4-epimerase